MAADRSSRLDPSSVVGAKIDGSSRDHHESVPAAVVRADEDLHMSGFDINTRDRLGQPDPGAGSAQPPERTGRLLAADRPQRALQGRVRRVGRSRRLLRRHDLERPRRVDGHATSTRARRSSSPGGCAGASGRPRARSARPSTSPPTASCRSSRDGESRGGGGSNGYAARSDVPADIGDFQPRSRPRRRRRQQPPADDDIPF